MPTTNGIAIRDAVFSRAALVAPLGFPDWNLARKVTQPTIQATNLPLLQVVLSSEVLNPDGDYGVGPVKFISETTISVTVARGLDDPVVLDGRIDLDLAGILDALFNDNSFTNPDKNSPFYFEGVSRIDSRRGALEQMVEGYCYTLTAAIAFVFRIEFSPPAPYWLEEADVEVKGLTGIQLAAQMGQIRYMVSPVTAGPPLVYAVSLEGGASFTGRQSITIDDGGVFGTINAQYGDSGLSRATVFPPNRAVFFSFSYTPPSSPPALINLTFTNAQGWPDPPPAVIRS